MEPLFILAQTLCIGLVDLVVQVLFLTGGQVFEFFGQLLDDGCDGGALSSVFGVISHVDGPVSELSVLGRRKSFGFEQLDLFFGLGFFCLF